MEVAGMCDICMKLMVRHSCPLCGAKVCDACYDYTAKACRNCGAGKRIAPAKEEEREGGLGLDGLGEESEGKMDLGDDDLPLI